MKFYPRADIPAIIFLCIALVAIISCNKGTQKNIVHLSYGYDDRTHICFTEDSIGVPVIIPCSPEVMKLIQ